DPQTSNAKQTRADDPASRCGLRLYTSEWEPTCQASLDTKCCDEEQLCARDPACVRLVNCANDCPRPRTGACIKACGPPSDKTPGFPQCDTVAACAKRANAPCPWPTGGGH